MFPFVINWSQLVKRLNKKPVIWFAIFVFFIFFKSVFMSYFIEDISQIKKLFQVLLLLILSFGLKEKSVGYLKLGIVLGTLTACVYSLIKICIIVFQTGVFNFTKGPLINETLTVQRLYLGLLCTFSLIFVLERLLKNRKKMGRSTRPRTHPLFLGLHVCNKMGSMRVIRWAPHQFFHAK